MIPPGQGLGPDQPIIGAGILRLEQDLDLARIQRLQQIGLKLRRAAPGPDPESPGCAATARLSPIFSSCRWPAC